MCQFFSGLALKNGDILTDPLLDSHSDLVLKFGLPDDTPHHQHFAKWELTPPGDTEADWLDVPRWNFRLDEPTAPGWWSDVAAQVEASARLRVEKMILKSGSIPIITEGCYILAGDIQIKRFMSGRIVRVFNGTVAEMMGGTLQHFRGGTLQDFWGGTLQDFWGGTLQHFWGGTLQHFWGGTLQHFRGGTLQDFWGGTPRLVAIAVENIAKGWITLSETAKAWLIEKKLLPKPTKKKPTKKRTRKAVSR